MMNEKGQELFEKHGVKHIWYYVGTNEVERQRFLRFAKNLEFCWMNGDEIKPEADNCATVMGLNTEGKMGQVSLRLWSMFPGVQPEDYIRLDFASGRWLDDPDGEPFKCSYVVKK